MIYIGLSFSVGCESCFVIHFDIIWGGLNMCCWKNEQIEILRVMPFVVIFQALCKIGSSHLQLRNAICCLSTVLTKTFHTSFFEIHVWRFYLLSFDLF